MSTPAHKGTEAGQWINPEMDKLPRLSPCQAHALAVDDNFGRKSYNSVIDAVKIEELENTLRYVFEHYGECKPGHIDFMGWKEQISARVRRGY